VRNPHSLPTFLVDGAVAGTWRHRAGRIELDPFERLDAATLRELPAEGERLAAFTPEAELLSAKLRVQGGGAVNAPVHLMKLSIVSMTTQCVSRPAASVGARRRGRCIWIVPAALLLL
jgi:hypothetical protein